MLDFINDLFQVGTYLRSNVIENENGYILNVLMPGVNKDDIDIEVEDGSLKISVKALDGADSNDTYLVHEFSSQAASRSFYLGEINEESIKAKLNDGVLTVEVNKKEPEASKKRIIQID